VTSSDDALARAEEAELARRTVIFRGSDPPYPPMSARAGLIAKTAIVSGPPARTVISRKDASRARQP